jgi:hypothetical protein
LSSALAASRFFINISHEIEDKSTYNMIRQKNSVEKFSFAECLISKMGRHEKMPHFSQEFFVNLRLSLPLMKSRAITQHGFDSPGDEKLMTTFRYENE